METGNITHVAHIVTDLGLSMFIDGKSHVVPKDHINYPEILAAMREKRYDDLPALLDPQQVVFEVVQEFTVNDPNFSYEHGILHYRSKPLPTEISGKIVRMVREGSPLTPLLRFVEKLWRNPSATARREALLFFVANAMMIHEDGDFIAYKTVREDFRDKHSGSIDNSVGATVAMDRAEVDDRRDVTCSFGLHFAAYEYAAGIFYSSGDRIVVLKINPADVVSIPLDYANQKGRACRYEVIAELPAPEPTTRPEPLPSREYYNYRDVGGLSSMERQVRDVVAKFVGSHDPEDIHIDDALADHLYSRTDDYAGLELNLRAEFGVCGDFTVYAETTIADIATIIGDLIAEEEEEDSYFEEEDEEDSYFAGDDEDDEDHELLLNVGDTVLTSAGRVGEVTEVDPAAWLTYRVAYEGSGDHLWFPKSDLTVVTNNVGVWKGHLFDNGVCLCCHGREAPIRSLGWNCQPR